MLICSDFLLTISSSINSGSPGIHLSLIHTTTHKETENTDNDSFCLQVKPVIKLLKQTLVGTGALLVSAVMLFIFATPAEDFIQNAFGIPNVSAVEVKADDDLAAAAAEAADGRPVYCRDRFYRALAGGQYCKWEDLLK